MTDKHIQARAYPSQVEAALQSSVTRSGLRIVGTQYPVMDQTGRILWYDVAAMAGDKLTLIDLEDWRHSEKTQAKVEYCNAHNIPLLLVPMDNVETMETKVQIWSIKLRRNGT